VLEQVERDLAAIQQAGCTLVLALNTHAHADHITGSGLLKAKLGNDKIPVRSAISRASGASADILLEDGEEVTWANGKRRLRVIATPGHTAGCVCYYDPTMQVVFTGDVLLIGGCGRTDFQGGSSETLYESVHTRLFTMPDTTLVYPAHDYKGRRYSTIGAEKATNPRLTKTKSDFVELMAGLNLPYPKKIDAPVPAPAAPSAESAKKTAKKAAKEAPAAAAAAGATPAGGASSSSVSGASTMSAVAGDGESKKAKLVPAHEGCGYVQRGRTSLGGAMALLCVGGHDLA